jgi:hypothetical protein
MLFIRTWVGSREAAGRAWRTGSPAPAPCAAAGMRGGPRSEPGPQPRTKTASPVPPDAHINLALLIKEELFLEIDVFLKLLIVS